MENKDKQRLLAILEKQRSLLYEIDTLPDSQAQHELSCLASNITQKIQTILLEGERVFTHGK
jgi:hypothetical protein